MVHIMYIIEYGLKSEVHPDIFYLRLVLLVKTVNPWITKG